jgi:PleD family two-component response regulator
MSVVRCGSGDWLPIHQNFFYPLRIGLRPAHNVVLSMGRILVIDDHADTVKPLLRILHLEGYTATGAANAYEAIASVQQASPDLILLDVMIPPIDGLTFLMRLREDAKSREIPVIVVSGLSDPQTMARAKELGVRESFIKTQFTSDELLASIAKYIKPKKL